MGPLTARGCWAVSRAMENKDPQEGGQRLWSWLTAQASMYKLKAVPAAPTWAYSLAHSPHVLTKGSGSQKGSHLAQEGTFCLPPGGGLGFGSAAWAGAWLFLPSPSLGLRKAAGRLAVCAEVPGQKPGPAGWTSLRKVHRGRWDYHWAEGRKRLWGPDKASQLRLSPSARGGTDRGTWAVIASARWL